MKNEVSSLITLISNEFFFSHSANQNGSNHRSFSNAQRTLRKRPTGRILCGQSLGKDFLDKSISKCSLFHRSIWIIKKVRIIRIIIHQCKEGFFSGDKRRMFVVLKVWKRI